jgi:molybdopterin synthase catalytic subunit
MTLHDSVRSSRSPSKCRPALTSAIRGIATLMVAAGTAIAQTGGGATLVGTVKDATGATVAGAPNTTYNLNNAGAWARFTGVVRDFSNFGSAQANVQISIRAEF